MGSHSHFTTMRYGLMPNPSSAWPGYFTKLLTGAVAAPESQVGLLPLLGEEELQRLVGGMEPYVGGVSARQMLPPTIRSTSRCHT